jgi:phage repressor protein C with HTH and peptisase S24 domain
MAQLGDNGFWADVEYPVGHGDGYIDWPTSDPDAYAIECSGDSMRPRIKHGEFVIIEPNHPIQPGEEVMVKSKDGRVMVKEMAYKSAGRYTLLSVNEAHGKIVLNEDDIDKIHYVAGIAKKSMWRPD